MSRKITFALSVSLEIWALAFLIPLIYMEGLGGGWSGVMRILPYLFALVGFTLAILGLYKDCLVYLRFGRYWYAISMFWTMWMIFFAMHPSSAYVCREYNDI